MATFIQRAGSKHGIVLTANTNNVRAGLTAFLRSVGDRRDSNRRIALLMQTWVDRNFARGGALQEPAWAPLKASTLREKARKGYSSLPLIRTGGLRASFYPEYDNDTASVASDDPVAVHHQYGTKYMRRRPMLPPNSYVREVAVDIYGKLLQNSARRAGLK